MLELETKDNIKNFIYEKEDLEKLTTEQLVGFIRHINDWHAMYFRDWHLPGDYEERYKEYIDKYVCVHEYWPDNYPTAYYWADEKVLREILKTRPNIPNKIQRKRMILDKIHKNRKNTKRNLKYQR